MGLSLTKIAVVMQLADERKYLCPECGYLFKAKWYNYFSFSQMAFWWAHIVNYKLYVKCPNCKIKNICVKPRD